MSFDTHDFEGRTFHTLDFGGQPAWFAREIGAIAGYTGRGQRLLKKMRRDWRDELIQGVDYLYIASPPEGLQTHVPLGEHPMVLLRPGIDMVLAKTCKPQGKRLRRYIVERVLPRWEPVEPVAPPSALGPGESTDPFVLRETRLRDKLDYQDRRFRSTALARANRVLRDLGRIDDQTFAFTELMATQIALGVDLSDLHGTEVPR